MACVLVGSEASFWKAEDATQDRALGFLAALGSWRSCECGMPLARLFLLSVDSASCSLPGFSKVLLNVASRLVSHTCIVE